MKSTFCYQILMMITIFFGPYFLVEEYLECLLTILLMMVMLMLIEDEGCDDDTCIYVSDHFKLTYIMYTRYEHTQVSSLSCKCTHEIVCMSASASGADLVGSSKYANCRSP